MILRHITGFILLLSCFPQVGWAKEKDTALLFSGIVQDSFFFIYHPHSASTIRDYRMFRDLAVRSWLRPEFKATWFRIKDLDIHISASGITAWFSCLLDDFAEWNGNKIGWVNCRWTGVLETRNNHWVFVRMHFSFPDDKK